MASPVDSGAGSSKPSCEGSIPSGATFLPCFTSEGYVAIDKVFRENVELRRWLEIGKMPKELTRCEEHPRYRAIRAPRVDCPTCWCLYTMKKIKFWPVLDEDVEVFEKFRNNVLKNNGVEVVSTG